MHGLESNQKRQSELINKINLILKVLGFEERIHNYQDVKERLWLVIFRRLLNKKLGVFSEVRTDSDLEDFIEVLNNSYFRSTPICYQSLLKANLDTVYELVHTINEIYEEIVWRLHLPTDKFRQDFSLHKLQKVLKFFNIKSCSAASFAELSPKVWAILLEKLFLFPEVEDLLSIIEKDPAYGMETLLLTLSKKVLKRPLEHIDPRLVSIGDSTACCLLAEIFVALSRTVLLKPMEDIRLLSYTTTAEPSTLLTNPLQTLSTTENFGVEKDLETKNSETGHQLNHSSTSQSFFQPAALRHKTPAISNELPYSVYNATPYDDTLTRNLKEKRKSQYPSNDQT